MEAEIKKSPVSSLTQAISVKQEEADIMR